MTGDEAWQQDGQWALRWHRLAAKASFRSDHRARGRVNVLVCRVAGDDVATAPVRNAATVPAGYGGKEQVAVMGWVEENEWAAEIAPIASVAAVQ